ncbi:IclR family transcriptional regulator [Homoserinimonas sp. A447]
MSSTLLRAFTILELLTGKPDGMRLSDIATTAELPKSAVHRTLAHLSDVGYVRQDPVHGRYMLSLRMLSRAVRHLANLPLMEVAAPLLDELAAASGELVRLSVADGDTLVWVAKRQGARFGLRYDPQAGREIKLIRASSGLAWLSGLEHDRAVAIVDAQGFDDLDDYGPHGPSTRGEALAALAEVTELGYSYTDATFELGTAAIAVPIQEPGQDAVGALNIAGPSVRLLRENALELLPMLRDAADVLAVLSSTTSPVPLTDEP